MDYKNPKYKKEYIIYRDKQISKLDTLLKDWTEIDVKYKNSVLISYWLDIYEKLLRNEDFFKSQKSYMKYKRGQILYINFGYRIGHELGGNHYAVVVSNCDSIRSGNVTVVPLLSDKGRNSHPSKVHLGDSLKNSLSCKIKKQTFKNNERLEKIALVLQSMTYVISQLENREPVDSEFCEHLKKEYSSSKEFQNLLTELDTSIQKNDFEDMKLILKKMISSLEKQEKEYRRMETNLNNSDKLYSKINKHTIADTLQITTISKARVLNPIRSNDSLSDVRLESKYLDIINSKIKDLYIFDK